MEGASAAQKKTWLTEFGFPTPNGNNEALQSSNLTAAINAIKSKNYIAATQWFQLDDNAGADLAYGLYRENLTAKPSLNAFQTAATYQGRYSNTSPISRFPAITAPTAGSRVNGSPYDNGGGFYVHAWDFGDVQDFDGAPPGAARSSTPDTALRGISGRPISKAGTRS